MRRKAITGTKYGDGGTASFPPEQTSGANSCWPISAARNICIEALPTADTEDDRPSLPDEVATGCHLREHRRLSGRQNAGPEHRQTRSRGLVSENRTQASAADPVFDDFWKNSLPRPRPAPRVILSFSPQNGLLYWMDEQYRECGQSNQPRLEFEAAAMLISEHLRPWLEALKKLPGVYQFHGDGDDALYIGRASTSAAGCFPTCAP